MLRFAPTAISARLFHLKCRWSYRPAFELAKERHFCQRMRAALCVVLPSPRRRSTRCVSSKVVAVIAACSSSVLESRRGRRRCRYLRTALSIVNVATSEDSYVEMRSCSGSLRTAILCVCSEWRAEGWTTVASGAASETPQRGCSEPESRRAEWLKGAHGLCRLNAKSDDQ